MSNSNDPKSKDFSMSEETVFSSPVVSPTPFALGDDDEATVFSSDSNSPFVNGANVPTPQPMQFGVVEETRLLDNSAISSSDSNPPKQQNSSKPVPAPTQVNPPFDDLSLGVQTPDRSTDNPFAQMSEYAASEQNDLDDDDVASERTVLHGGLNTAEPAQLVVITGPEQDKIYPLIELVVSFGRETDNTISFPDRTVSRHHFKIHQKSGRYELEDLGSGNGTLVNGKRYKNKRVFLKHGDKIQVGKSFLQFIIVGKPLSKDSKSSTMLFVGLFIGLLFVGGALFAYFKFMPNVQHKGHKEQIRQLMEDSNTFANQRKWRKAKSALQKAFQLDSKNLLVQQRILEISAEEKAQLFLRKAKLFYKTKEYRDALSAIRQADKILTAGSVYADEIWNLRFKLEQKLKIGVASHSSQTCFWRKQNRWLLKCCYKKNKSSAKCKRFRRLRRRDRRKLPPPPRKEEPINSPNPPTLSSKKQALQMYNLGRIGRALELLKSAGAFDLVNKIKKFRTVYQQGKTEHNLRNPSSALGPLIEALQLDQEISHGKSRFTRQVKMMLSNMYATKGMFAMSSHNPCLAFRSFQTSIRYNRNHLLAKGKLKSLEVFASKQYEAALKILKSERTLSKGYLRKAMCTLPHSHPIFIKAKKTLNSL